MIQTAPLPKFSCKSTVLAEVPGIRRVVQYQFFNTVNPAEPPFGLVAKFYSDLTGQHTYRFMKRLQLALSQLPDAPLRIPSVFFYDSQFRLLAQEETDGVNYSFIVRRRDAEKYFRIAGKALASLHSLKELPARKKTLRDHLKELIHPHPLILADRFPEHRSQIFDLLSEFSAKEKDWKETAQFVPVHRDFHLKQLFYVGKSVTVIDWDLLAKGDAALDVGNFIVYLETHVVDKHMRLADAFLESYFSFNRDSIMKRIPLYKSFTYLRLASKNFRLLGKNTRVTEMIRQAEKALGN